MGLIYFIIVVCYNILWWVLHGKKAKIYYNFENRLLSIFVWLYNLSGLYGLYYHYFIQK